LRGVEVQFAVVLPVGGGRLADPDWVAGFATYAEELGFESLVAVEHPDEDCSIPDPLELLSFLAASTSSIGLATGVLILPVHHPVVLAKRLATLDRLSRGRLRLCIGTGWMLEELESCGVDIERRGRQADESIDILRLLWATDGPEGASHGGELYRFDGARSYPKPVGGSIPIHIGGHSVAAARRAGRRGDGFQPLGLRGNDLAEKIFVMRTAAAQVGRNPESLELSLGGPLGSTGPDQVEAAQELGAVRFVGTASPTGDLNEACDELASFMARVGSTTAGTKRD
jgi:probable F420-dependent oxidoreductase